MINMNLILEIDSEIEKRLPDYCYNCYSENFTMIKKEIYKSDKRKSSKRKKHIIIKLKCHDCGRIINIMEYIEKKPKIIY